MRFSHLFQQPAPATDPRREEEPREEIRTPAPPAAAELPEELDARVRLLGEWQLGEG